jgi:hypothetical protein
VADKERTLAGVAPRKRELNNSLFDLHGEALYASVGKSETLSSRCIEN